MASEVWSVAEDRAVIFDGDRVEVRDGLEPDTAYEGDGVAWRTLPRPGGELLATVAAVNDLHFGEVQCGLLAGIELGPVLTTPPGAPPYPETMNRAAVAEIAALDPAAVVVKGDVTTVGDPAEHAAFEACYRPAFDGRLVVTRGNHDNKLGRVAFEAPPVEAVPLPGVVLAVLDTSRPSQGGGFVDDEQLDWLDALAAGADRPVLVFGHHPCYEPGAPDWPGPGSHLDPKASLALIEVVARRRSIVGYLAGHTHRNRVRHFTETGPVPFAEVASVKDFPGSWAEYRVFEGGILQVHHRLAAPEALAWSESCRALFAGLYPRYAAGAAEERSFALPSRHR